MSGYLNRTTSSTSQKFLDGLISVTEPKKRGPKIGSKNQNKKTLPKESVSTTEPKKRGRPTGSKNKNKTTIPKESVSTTEPNKRGRPAGSKNSHPSKTKKNIAAATVIQKYVRNHAIC